MKGLDGESERPAEPQWDVKPPHSDHLAGVIPTSLNPRLNGWVEQLGEEPHRKGEAATAEENRFPAFEITRERPMETARCCLGWKEVMAS